MYLLIDIGGTSTRIAASKNLKNISDSKIIKTPKAYKDALGDIFKIAKGFAGKGKIRAVAVGVATPLDEEKSTVLYHSKKETFKDWVDKPLKKDLQKRLKAPVYLENDALMGAMGEAVFGPGRDHKIVAFLTISTGIGGNLIVDNKPALSARGFEPAWTVIDQGRGDLIGLADYGGDAITKLTGRKPEEIRDKRFWAKITKQIAIGIHNTDLMWSPHIIVLGGSLMKKIRLSDLRLELKKIKTPFKDRAILKKSSLGSLNGIYGAMGYLKQKL